MEDNEEEKEDEIPELRTTRNISCILNGCIACEFNNHKGLCVEHGKIGKLEARDLPYHCKQCGEYMEGRGKKAKSIW